MDIWNLRGRKLKYLSDAQANELHEACLYLLSTTGCLFRDEEALRIFADAGATVDFSRQLVRILPRLIEAGLRSREVMWNAMGGRSWEKTGCGCSRKYGPE